MSDDLVGKPRRKAEDNPWYWLATLHGADPLDTELQNRNRIAWNRCMVSWLTGEERERLAKTNRHPVEELTPFSREEWEEIETALQVRSEKRADIAELARSRIDFSRTEFEYLPFTGRVFPGRGESSSVDFAGATFSGTADFTRATFSSTADFTRATFSGAAYFVGATFSGTASFTRVTFSEVVNYDGTTFSGLANFLGATFSSVAYFTRVTFSGGAFAGVKFSDVANFTGVIFSIRVSFAGATFSSTVEFTSVMFSGVAYFASAAFSGTADFISATFSGGAYFTGATFSGTAYFAGATFSSYAGFINVEMKARASFEKVRFRVPPEFFGAKLHEGTTWRNVTWPAPPADREQAGEYVEAYERLKLEMDRLKKYGDELDFFARELQSRRILLGFWGGLPIAVYGFLSDYGRSHVRPLVLLVATVLAGILFSAIDLVGFWTPFLADLPHTRQAIGVSFANTFGVFGRPLMNPEVLLVLPDWLKAIATIQTILGIVLLFLFGLAIRNRFRMK